MTKSGGLENLKIKIGIVALACIAAFGLSADVAAQAKKSTKKPVAKKAVVRKAAPKAPSAEVRLVGIALFADGIEVINRYGNPTDVEAVGGGGGGAVGPTGARGPAGGAGGGARTNPRGGAGGGGGAAADALSIRPGTFNFGDEMLRLQGPPGTPSAAGAAAGGGGGGGQGPRRGGGPDEGAGPAGGPGGVGSGNTGEKILYTRWIYNRGPSKYGFVMNKFNKVVQVEAIGMNDAKVKTARGIGYGATFSQIIRKYGAPDGYEISGNSLVVRYLVKNKVAFRLNRLGENKPHVVTGIVVAGGKM